MGTGDDLLFLGHLEVGLVGRRRETKGLLCPGLQDAVVAGGSPINRELDRLHVGSGKGGYLFWGEEAHALKEIGVGRHEVVQVVTGHKVQRHIRVLVAVLLHPSKLAHTIAHIILPVQN
jgi:hypothetical protein